MAQSSLCRRSCRLDRSPHSNRHSRRKPAVAPSRSPVHRRICGSAALSRVSEIPGGSWSASVTSAREPSLSRCCANSATTRAGWRVKRAGMVKQGLNSFLARSVTCANDLATLCEQVGADAAEVEKGLRSDPRIGPGAYLRPGPAFAGGTLARDVAFLRGLAEKHSLALP